MRALLASLLVLATAVSADKLVAAPDTLHVHLSHLNSDDHSLQVTITNSDTAHAYIHDPSESLSNPKEDTFRVIGEPSPGAARFHGVVHGTITYGASSTAAGDWDRLRRWKEVALNAVRVPANGGQVSFNVMPTDHMEFSAPGTYALSMGLTLKALSADKSKVLRYHLSTNAINMTVSSPTSTDHNDKLSRRSLAGGDTTCSQRHALLVDAWAQQALFSVKDAKTEALGGKFHAQYKDDIHFCFGTDLSATHQSYLSSSLEKLQQLLDPKGNMKFAPFCDVSSTSDGCKPDSGNVADSWFTSTTKQIDLTLCGSFFYQGSHCAYQYKSATNKLAGILVRALQISQPIDTLLFETLLPSFEDEYKPAAVNQKLSAAQRIKFHPAWECFLARRSKDEIITKDACDADEQVSASALSAGLLESEIFADVAAIVGASGKKRRRLAEATNPESVQGRRRLIAAKPIRQIDGSDEGAAVAAMTERNPTTLINDPWTLISAARPVIAFVADAELNNRPLAYRGSSNSAKQLKQLVFGSESVKCDKIRKTIGRLSASNNLDRLHDALSGILAEAAGTGVYDLSSNGRQTGRLATLIDALANLDELAVTLKLAHGVKTAKSRCFFLHYRHAPKVLAALASEAKLPLTPPDWTQAEPRAIALARATVVTLVGAIFHNYHSADGSGSDYDLSGDEMMNHAIHRLNSIGDPAPVFRVLARAYGTVLRVAHALTIGGAGQTLVQFKELGLDKQFSRRAVGRKLVTDLIKNIHGYYDGTTNSLAEIPIPPSIPAEFELMNLLLRKKRQEVREMRATPWELYKDGIDALMVSGKYADFIFTHAKYFTGFRLHMNPRFLPWHRAFLITFDEELSKIMRRPIRAPYWDWTVESDRDVAGGVSSTTNSAIFTNAYFGRWGDDENGGYPEDPTTKPKVLEAPNLPDEPGYPGTATRKLPDTRIVQFGLCVPLAGPLPTIKNYDNVLKPDGTSAYAGLTADQKKTHDRCVTRGKIFKYDEEFPSTLMEPDGRPPAKSPMKQAHLNHLMAYGPHQPSPEFARSAFADKLEGDFHQHLHEGLRGDMVKGGSPADWLFWSHHAMLDNIWANWQAKDSENAVEYNRASVYQDGGKLDHWNEGFNHGWAPGAGDVTVPKGTKRDFKRDQRMVFLGPKLGNEANARWAIKQLMDDEGDMFRTLQYTKHMYKDEAQPTQHGLDTVGNVPVVFSDAAPVPVRG